MFKIIFGVFVGGIVGVLFTPAGEFFVSFWSWLSSFVDQVFPAMKEMAQTALR